MMAHFQPLTLPEMWPDAVPAGVGVVIKKALANNPADRYASAGELVADLRALAEPSGEPKPQANAAPPPPVNRAEPAKQRLHAPPDPPDFEPADDLPAEDDEDWLDEQTADWRGFFAHLGPYVLVIGGLGVMNLLTGSDYPWFLWPAIGWGIGIAFHLWGVISGSMTAGLAAKWKDFTGHVASYVIVIGALAMMNLLTGGSAWFLWPAAIWGIAVGIHFWNTLLGADDSSRAQRHAGRKEKWRQKREERRQSRRWPQNVRAAVSAAAAPDLASDSLQSHLLKARAYQNQIDDVIRQNTNQAFQPHLQEMATQVHNWVAAIEQLSRRVDTFQRNNIIRHDLESVPRAIKKLESQLAAETDPATRTELQRTLANRKTQLDALLRLQTTMKRAEIKIERTLSALGTLYPQILTGQSANQVAAYSRISSEVSEEVRTLKDHLEALEEVKFGQSDQS
jgi:hypothetical protein